jgi:hypothetical protein
MLLFRVTYSSECIHFHTFFILVTCGNQTHKPGVASAMLYQYTGDTQEHTIIIYAAVLCLSYILIPSHLTPIHGHRVPQWSKALHLSARGVTTDPGSIPDCITTGCDWESQRAAHNWTSVVMGLARVGRHCK